MKNILIIAYSFPPVGGAGVQRISKFVKYLPRFYWNPVVLTVSKASVPLEDNSLLRDISQGVQVIRAKTFEPSYSFKINFTNTGVDHQSTISRLKSHVKKTVKKYLHFLLIPDVQVLWWPGASLALLKQLTRKKIDIIFVTGPPYSSFLLAIFWGRVFRVPVVLDFRDEWVFSRNSWENAAKGKFFDWCDKKMEGWVVRNASLITVASPAYRDTILNNWKGVGQDKVVTVTNGYDSDDFHGVVPAEREEDEVGKFVIVYAGTVWKATSFKEFSIALDKFIEKNPESKDKIILKIVGRIVIEEDLIVSEIGKRIFIKKYGYLKHEETIRYMLGADALLLTLATMPGAEKIIPAKTFEYLAVQKPILAFIPDGVCKELLLSAISENQISFNDIFLSFSISNEVAGGINKKFTDYSREKLTKNLIDQLSKI